MVKCEICNSVLRKGRKRFCSIGCRSVAYTGEGNPFYGKSQTDYQKNAVRHHNVNEKDYSVVSSKLKNRSISDVTRKRLSISLKKWFSINENPMKGKTHGEHTKDVISKKVRERYLTSDLFKKRQLIRDERAKYYSEVWRLTEANDLTLLENHNKRAYRGYHLDHIVPISVGFNLAIPAIEIADISNLRFLWWHDNIKKRTNVVEIPPHLRKYFKKEL